MAHPIGPDIDTDEPPNNAVGFSDLSSWKVGFILGTPGPSGKSCADPTAPGTCP